MGEGCAIDHDLDSRIRGRHIDVPHALFSRQVGHERLNRNAVLGLEPMLQLLQAIAPPGNHHQVVTVGGQAVRKSSTDS